MLQTITVAACLAVCAGIVLAPEPAPARAEESKPSPKSPPAKTQPEKIVDGPMAAQQGKVRRPDATVVYADYGTEKMHIDIFLPKQVAEKGPRPAVLFIHGGGWRSQSRQDWYWWCQDLADRGYVTFTIDYRLANPHPAYHPYPAAVDDCQRAVRWIRANAAKYNIDPNRIASCGCSAGGHLSAMLGVIETRDNSDATLAKFSSRVNAVIDYFGPLDLADLGSPEANEIARNFLGGKTKDQAPEIYKDASPLSHVDKNAAPFLILHGKGDLIPFWQAEKMTELLKKAGVEVTLIPAKAGHGFHWNRDTDPAKEAWQAVLDFLERRFPDLPSAAAGKHPPTTKPD